MREVTSEETAKFGARLRETMKTAGPGILGGAIANIVGPIPNREWAELMADASTPCDQPGCTCHEVRPKAMAGLDALRSDWRKQKARLS